jgi:hypothetical protein
MSIEISSLVSTESSSMAEASELIKSFRFFQKAKSFTAIGNYVSIAFLGSSLKPEINGSEETGRKLITSSFVDDRDIFVE